MFESCSPRPSRERLKKVKNMKVKELKELLKDIDDESIVILQKDAEGNEYSPLDGINDECVYAPDSTWSGDIRFPKLTAELKKYGYTQEDCGDGEPCVVFVPVN